MKIFSDDLDCLAVYLTTLAAVACLIMGPEYTVNGKGRLVYEFWPEFWIIFPVLFLGLNIFFIFLERSILGIISITVCVGWIIYSIVTFPIVLHILEK